MRIAIIALLLLLAGMAQAQNLTVAYYHIGYGTADVTEGIGGEDMVLFTSMLAFVVLAAGFAYLHSKSNNFVWSSIWLALMFVMIEAAVMGMQIQAKISGDAQTEGIMVALFAIIFWLLVVIMAVFAFNLIRRFLKLTQEAVNGKKK